MKNNEKNIMVVDDEFSVRDALGGWFRKDGYKVQTAQDGHDALGKLKDTKFDVVLLDIKMPGMNGIEVLKRLREVAPDTVVVMLTAHGTVDTAVEAMKNGAFDYITKPADPVELSRVIHKAMELGALKTENKKLKEKLDTIEGSGEIIGETPSMLKVKELVSILAKNEVTVLIRGESGTGKELVARAIHQSGPRRFFSLVPVNCGAIPESLLESELFGHEKGAFTGAQHRHKGKLELADGGTLFLDELGSIGSKMQVELLRVLDSREYTRVGGVTPINVDFRVVCATNQNLEQLVEFGAFRQDLYFRINVFTIVVPPLRDRVPDIPLLVNHFISLFSRRMNIEMPEVSLQAMDRLKSHDWPGNIRELANTIERSIVLAQGSVIRPEHLSVPFSSHGPSTQNASLDEIAREHIRKVLESNDWNISKAAFLLQIDRATLYNKIKKYGLRA